MSSVYTWGDNRRSQLGGCSKEKTVYEPKHLSSLDGMSIVKTSHGASHSLYLSSFGDVLSCGRNVEGQCGMDTKKKDVTAPEIIKGPLSEHRVIQICCSAYSSYVVTSSGRMYEFGLLHESEARPNWNPQTDPKPRSRNLRQQQQQPNGHDESKQTDTGRTGNTSGRLTGLAVSSTHSTIVSRIVRRSELRYLQDGCEEGVSLDEGVLAVKTKKVIVSIPRVVASLNGIQISFAAAGDGHIIAVARDGRMFACGSNDRGQLGDGTRVNRASFVPVMPIQGYEPSKGWFPVSVAIGQQHNVVLLRQRRLQAEENEKDGENGTDDKNDKVGNDSKDDDNKETAKEKDFKEDQDSTNDNNNSMGIIFSWGSGALGQLGMGSGAKDSLRPRPILGLLENKNIISISCGSNHSAAVTKQGQVYMWGHSEYGQLDPGSAGGRDRRHHGRYYYTPRLFEIKNSRLPIQSIACTTHATIAIDTQGQTHAWGWNSHGVLGRGKGRVGLGAQHIWKLRDKNVKHVSCGHGHISVISLSNEKAFDLAKRFHSILLLSNEDENGDSTLGRSPFADLNIQIENDSIWLHACLLQARCPKLLSIVIDATNTYLKDIRLDTFSVLIEYIYRDEVDWRKAKRGRRTLADDVLRVALNLDLARLASMCISRTSKTNSSFVATGNFGVLSGNRGAMLREITRKANTVVLRDVNTRKNRKAMKAVVAPSKVAEPTMAPPAPPTVPLTMEKETTGETKANTNTSTSTSTNEVATIVPSSTYQKEMLDLLALGLKSDVCLSSHNMKDTNQKPIPVHKAILCRYPFFRALLNGRWKESKSDVVMLGENLSRDAMLTVLKFVYTGDSALVNDDNVMELLHCASIFDLEDLKNISEHYVSLRLDVDNAEDCLGFASMLGLDRLAREAKDILEFSNVKKDNENKE